LRSGSRFLNRNDRENLLSGGWLDGNDGKNVLGSGGIGGNNWPLGFVKGGRGLNGNDGEKVLRGGRGANDRDDGKTALGGGRFGTGGKGGSGGNGGACAERFEISRGNRGHDAAAKASNIENGFCDGYIPRKVDRSGRGSSRDLRGARGGLLRNRVAATAAVVGSRTSACTAVTNRRRTSVPSVVEQPLPMLARKTWGRAEKATRGLRAAASRLAAPPPMVTEAQFMYCSRFPIWFCQVQAQIAGPWGASAGMSKK
jgi:hypothetical protein